MKDSEIRERIKYHEEWIATNDGRVYVAEKDTMWRHEAIKALKERMGEEEGSNGS